MTSTNQNTEAKASESKLRIEVEPIAFDGLIKGKYTTTMELSKLVNSVFKASMADYEGSLILPTPNGQYLECTLYFKNKNAENSDQIKNLVPVGASQGNKRIDRYEAFNSRTTNKMFTLTEETKQILSDFIVGKPGQKIDWNKHVFEQAEQVYNGNIVYVKVVGIDLYKILKTIYGGKIDGDRCDYNISVLRPSGPNNHLICIQQLDTKEVEKLAQSVGLLQTVGSVMMVRG